MPVKIFTKIAYIYNKLVGTPIRTLYLQKTVKKCGDRLKVNKKSFISGRGSIILGNNNNFNGITIYGDGGLTIGDNFHSGKECKIITQNHNFKGSEIPYDSTFIKKPITVGDNVWIGDNVIILPGSVIEEGAIIGAGSVVRGKIEKYAITIGNPAIVVKHRDKDHYERLKEQGKFH